MSALSVGGAFPIGCPPHEYCPPLQHLLPQFPFVDPSHPERPPVVLFQMVSSKPSGSTKVSGFAPTYGYVFTPAASPIGSLSTYLPTAGS
jgi:hypothetical protein